MICMGSPKALVEYGLFYIQRYKNLSLKGRRTAAQAAKHPSGAVAKKRGIIQVFPVFPRDKSNSSARTLRFITDYEIV